MPQVCSPRFLQEWSQTSSPPDRTPLDSLLSTIVLSFSDPDPRDRSTPACRVRLPYRGESVTYQWYVVSGLYWTRPRISGRSLGLEIHFIGPEITTKVKSLCSFLCLFWVHTDSEGVSSLSSPFHDIATDTAPSNRGRKSDVRLLRGILERVSVVGRVKRGNKYLCSGQRVRNRRGHQVEKDLGDSGVRRRVSLRDTRATYHRVKSGVRPPTRPDYHGVTCTSSGHWVLPTTHQFRKPSPPPLPRRRGRRVRHTPPRTSDCP